MKSNPSAESLFKTLKAENEPWLDAVFVSLPVFERLKEEHSSILYGDTGSGKTAMRMALSRQADEKTFTVLWTPEPDLEDTAAGMALARQGITQALRACVETLVLQGNLPQRLGEPPPHIAAALGWFLRNYLPFEAGFYLQSEPRLPQADAQWYLKLLGQSLPPLVTERTTLRDQVGLFSMALRAAKYERLWLMIDGLERWTLPQSGKQVEALLEAILSTLIFFDLPGVTFKFFVPASLKGILHKTSGVERHRAAEADLTWSVESLQAMLEKRLQYALSSSKKVTLDALCESGEFLKWLSEYGGDSPRAWLEFAAPLIVEYQQKGKRLTAAQTREFICQHPAPLRLDRERREIWLGRKCISFASAPEFRVLEYLALRPGKIGSLEELYYYAYKELETVPDKGEPAWTSKQTWRAAMDNLLWRLRKKIEPNPKEPIYLITHHGKGLELLHAQV
jgi:hypothetical protein